jgi:hypothetical protein
VFRRLTAEDLESTAAEPARLRGEIRILPPLKRMGSGRCAAR